MFGRLFYGFVFLVIIAMLLQSLLVDRISKPLSNRARYDFHRLYRVELATQQHVQLFQQLEAKSDSYTFYAHACRLNQQIQIMVSAAKVAEFADLLEIFKVKHSILTYNFQEQVNQNLKAVRPILAGSSKLDWQHYFQLETIYEWMQKLAMENADYVTLLDMGNSTQGLPIKGLKLGNAVDKKTIFIESGIHAREWIAPATATYIINELITSTDSTVQRLAQQYNWIVFPVVNPDGYKYTFTHDRMWRKNRALHGNCLGVDLNRNYPHQWKPIGASCCVCRQDYAGPAAASEVETQRLIKFIEDNIQREHIKTYFSLHSYSQRIMFPYGYTRYHATNYNDLAAIAQKACEKIEKVSGRDYKSGSIYDTIYPTPGCTQDWAYAGMRIPITFSLELRGPDDSKHLFLLPASEIKPTAEEAFAAILTIVQEAELRGYYK